MSRDVGTRARRGVILLGAMDLISYFVFQEYLPVFHFLNICARVEILVCGSKIVQGVGGVGRGGGIWRRLVSPFSGMFKSKVLRGIYSLVRDGSGDEGVEVVTAERVWKYIGGWKKACG